MSISKEASRISKCLNCLKLLHSRPPPPTNTDRILPLTEEEVCGIVLPVLVEWALMSSAVLRKGHNSMLASLDVQYTHSTVRYYNCYSFT